MPKDITLYYSRLRYFEYEFGDDDVFSIEVSILFCKLCGYKVNSDEKFKIMQHIKTDKHIKAIKREQNKIEKIKQQLLTNVQEKSTFNVDFCKTFISSNIPLNKLFNDKVKLFLRKYTKNPMPEDLTSRELYVDDITYMHIAWLT